MKSITFTIHSSTGSSEERYSRYIMIDKPKMSISFYFNEEDLEILEIQSVSQLVHEVKTTNHCVEEMLADWGMENFTVQTTYIKRKDHLLALNKTRLWLKCLQIFKQTIWNWYTFMLLEAHHSNVKAIASWFTPMKGTISICLMYMSSRMMRMSGILLSH